MNLRRMRSGGVHADSESDYLNVLNLYYNLIRKLANWKNNKKKELMSKKLKPLKVLL